MHYISRTYQRQLLSKKDFEIIQPYLVDQHFELSYKSLLRFPDFDLFQEHHNPRNAL
ncbi:hypothetical protein PHYBLDRAFT_160898 [Phycomyces blakesleeanus NRRL 1555(-)]|uniref:Uncharacterized protein n=1 Tax=Phycomyces blakesleeanus (strain ATCC 8743b / DSM 1359 / FGSC 10004 / NBRC 33097 / NRRL 1555) TaxID=763407 RepID=A0A162PF56_PHYB8|nr:hypothetical protein PHYBLDRAFT_160898 [Phycomyces blakesleeanus NRRL 1555(-)]OAD65106.1 hypothetical protein PHYBLDRAFT_160898 [Phycomyces blakesleeanus NRRL 1555(-)]|eukprot:XP_018283146.1 hypothetical protein PHYBLDRAFT_160898 [Phycomyces blakesleeanus NRRL 1555(-)]